jgi:hypothetical protein
MRRRALLAMAGGNLLVTSPVGAESYGRAGSSALSQDDGGTGSGGLSGQIETDRTRIELSLQSDGSANWELELWTRLDSDEAESAFDSLQTDVRTDPSSVLDQFRTRMTDTVAATDDATDREMAARDFAVRTERRAIPQDYGLLVYSFVWEGFAMVEGETLRAGDAIDGMLLETGTRLSIRWPAEYDRRTVDPPPDDVGDNVLAWAGDETDFLTGQPRVVVSRESNSGSSDGPPWPLVGGSVVGTLGLAVLLWWYRSSTGRLSPFGGEPDSGGTGDRSNEPATDSTTGSDTADEPPAELLSNEEHVLRLLEEQGGRMKQQQVVAELDWTEAKTSQVVSALREDEQIEVFRIGRENVLALPEETGI